MKECKECLGLLNTTIEIIEIGGIGGTITEIDSEGKVCLQRGRVLYQCPICKTLEID